MKSKRLCLVLIVGVCILSGGWGLSADCNTFPDSAIEPFDGDYYCAGWGSGCTECTNSGGGACVTNGESCSPGPFQQTP
jgi:hypothetical protein